jgi:hypothetical protein
MAPALESGPARLLFAEQDRPKGQYSIVNAIVGPTRWGRLVSVE